MLIRNKLSHIVGIHVLKLWNNFLLGPAKCLRWWYQSINQLFYSAPKSLPTKNLVCRT